MRCVVGLVLSITGCVEDSGQLTCGDSCPEPVTLSWTFQKYNGDGASPCLPGNPDVTVDFHGVQIVPCSAGSVTVPIGVLPDGALDWSVNTVTDRPWSVTGTYYPSAAPPHATFWTDVGDLSATWTIGAGSAQEACRDLRFLLDGNLFGTLPCTNQRELQAGLLSHVPTGPHTLTAQGLDAGGNVVATSDPVQVSLDPMTTGNASFELHAP